LASGAEKSGAALPTDGESEAKAAVVTRDARTARTDFVFINY
jgi:hypothetical protein